MLELRKYRLFLMVLLLVFLSSCSNIGLSSSLSNLENSGSNSSTSGVASPKSFVYSGDNHLPKMLTDASIEFSADENSVDFGVNENFPVSSLNNTFIYPTFRNLPFEEAERKINETVEQAVMKLENEDLYVTDGTYEVTLANKSIISIIFSYKLSPANTYPTRNQFELVFFTETGELINISEYINFEENFLHLLMRQEYLVPFSKPGAHTAVIEYLTDPDMLKLNLAEMKLNPLNIHYHFSANGDLLFSFHTIHAIGDFASFKINISEIVVFLK